MPTLGDWVAQVREAVAERDYPRYVDLCAELALVNPVAADAFADAAEAAQLERMGTAHLECRARTPVPDFDSNVAHVCRGALEHPGPHACICGHAW